MIAEEKEATLNERIGYPDMTNRNFRAQTASWLFSVVLLWTGVASAHGDGSPLATSQGITNLSSGTRGNEIGDAPDPDGLFGFSSDDSLQVPASQRPFQLALPRDHLFGDWFGVRPKVEDFG